MAEHDCHAVTIDDEVASPVIRRNKVSMAFRLLRYAIAAMQNHLQAGNETLPLVIPVLFYQGARTPYPWSMNWRDESHNMERKSWALLQNS